MQKLVDRTDEEGARIWLVWSNEHGAWWRPNTWGYTYQISEAGRYTEAEAIRHSQSRPATPTAPCPEVMLLAPEAQMARLDAMTDRMMRTEALRLLTIYEFPGSRCHAGHDNKVSKSLWECPRCTDRLRERLTKLRAQMDSFAEYDCETENDASCDCITCYARAAVAEDNALRDRPVEITRR